MKHLWKAISDNGMDIRTFIVLAETAEEAFEKSGGKYYNLQADDFKPTGDVFEAYESRWPGA